MNSVTGQIVRTVGLFIEMLGILALLFRTQTDQAGIPLPGSFPRPLVLAVTGVGFVIWMIGTMMIYWSRRVRAERKGRIEDDGELKL
jgi:hypothetical protein